MVRKYPWKAWHIAFGDGLLILVSFLLSYYLRYEIQFLRPVDEANFAPFAPFVPYTAIFIGWVLLANQSANLYQDQRERTLIFEVFKLTNAASNAAILVMALSFLLRPLIFSRLLIIQAAFISVVLLSGWRLAIRMLRRALHQRGIGVENVLLVGAGEVGRYVMRTLAARPDLGYRLVGFVDDDPVQGHKNIGRFVAQGDTGQLGVLVDKEQVDLVIVTLPANAQRKIVSIVEECERKEVEVTVVPDLFQLNMSQIKVEMLGGLPLLSVRHDLQFHRTSLVTKRVMDVLLTLLALPLVLPIMAISAVAIRMDSPGPILFHQTRVGLNGKEFDMIKFRSMYVQSAEAQTQPAVVRTEDDPEGKKVGKDDNSRITPVGRFIRRTSIDELPQLINVLRGEMSLVGPRPPLPEEIAVYKLWHRQRLMTRPGITGLWQVSGRSDIPFEEKVLLDIYYIENWSLGMDLQILLQTIPQVMFGKGAY